MQLDASASQTSMRASWVEPVLLVHDTVSLLPTPREPSSWLMQKLSNRRMSMSPVASVKLTVTDRSKPLGTLTSNQSRLPCTAWSPFKVPAPIKAPELQLLFGSKPSSTQGGT